MTGKSKTGRAFKTLKQRVNGVDFYCELRGSGPAIVLIPPGDGDCGAYAMVADILSDEFTILTFDMRGCSRSGRPADWTGITPEILAEDVAGIIRALDLAPASVYGCSSGGQTCLSLGVRHPEILRNIIVHEAALLCDAPLSGPDLPDGGEATRYLKHRVLAAAEIMGSKKTIFQAMLPILIDDDQAFQNLDPAYLDRVSQNGDVWVDLYMEPVSRRSYTAEELAGMPPVVFSAGLFSPAWMTEANRRTAERAGLDVVWLPCHHYVHISHPALLADHIREQTQKHLN
jgi:pimeloyl-ACP methyl ester carboxylesterase